MKFTAILILALSAFAVHAQVPSSATPITIRQVNTLADITTFNDAAQKFNQWSSEPHADSSVFRWFKRADLSMAKFYKDADRLMAFQFVAIACLFLGAIGIIAVPGLGSRYKMHKLLNKKRNSA